MKKCLLIVLPIAIAITGLSSCTQTTSSVTSESNEQTAVITQEYRYNGNSYFANISKNDDGTVTLLPGPDNEFIQSIYNESESGEIIDPSNPNIIWLAKNHVEFDSMFSQLKRQVMLTKANIVSLPPQFSIPPQRGVHIYKNANFSGEHLLVRSSINDLRSCGFNDAISSILSFECGGATMYEHPNFEGNCIGIFKWNVAVSTTWISNLSDEKMSGALWWKKSWNDRASSIRIY